MKINVTMKKKRGSKISFGLDSPLCKMSHVDHNSQSLLPIKHNQSKLKNGLPNSHLKDLFQIRNKIWHELSCGFLCSNSIQTAYVSAAAVMQWLHQSLIGSFI